MSEFVTAPQSKGLPLRLQLARHPLTAYFIIAYAGTWLADLPLVLGQDGLGLFQYHVPLPLYVFLFILGAYAGPTLAAFLVTASLDGRAGVQSFLRRYVQWRIGIQWYLVAILGCPLIYLAASSIWLGAEPLRAVVTNWPAFFSAYLPALLIFPALITWGEEPGWRGFALTRMQARYHPLLASLVVGLLHGIWHLPIFLLVDGPVAAGPFNLGTFVLNTVVIMAISILWTWVFNHAMGSILMAVLLHASFNAAQAYIAGVVPGFSDAVSYTAEALFLLLAILLIAATKGQLSYRPLNVPVQQSRSLDA